MSAEIPLNWFESNQQYLVFSLAHIRGLLERRLTDESVPVDSVGESDLHILRETMAPPPALETLCSLFGLSCFERDILLLCAGIELDSRFSALLSPQAAPTFSLAMSSLPDPHWSALSPASSLRYWRLIEMGAGSAVTQNSLRIDERILHYLTGTPHLDERLMGYIKRVNVNGELVPSQESVAQQIVKIWMQHRGNGELPVIQLRGSEIAGKSNIAAYICETFGMQLHVLPARSIPSSSIESESLRRLWQRESALAASALLLDCDELDAEPGQEAIVRHWIESADYPLIVSSRERRSTGLKRVITFEVSRPTAAEQRQLWQTALDPLAIQLNGRVEALVSSFSLDAPTINSIALDALQNEHSSPEELDQTLWDACSNHTHPRLGELAQYIQPMAHWDDLVLPEGQVQTLHDIACQIRQRSRVYETWGFANKSARGLGISALFVGVSGTGKTMAAEVLANELRLQLYCIDLSQVVSKYIGETEKNLRRVFDAAEESSAVLLFDEADALFGKRSEVKDSHDRYANVEISYLLQRMEAYRGLAILTTNMKEALDQAFLRRLRFVVQFPFPDLTQRIEIWRRIFPAQTPTENLDVNRLAKLSITGGNIRNIALYAAFLAADTNEPVKMEHLVRAVRVEFTKLEKPLVEAEIGGWG